MIEFTLFAGLFFPSHNGLMSHQTGGIKKGEKRPVGKQRGIDIVEAMRLRLDHKATADEKQRASHNGD